MSRHVRGRVWITGDTVHYLVTVGSEVAFYDNTGVQMWQWMFKHALARVETIRHMHASGRRIKPYDGFIARPPSRDHG